MDQSFSAKQPCHQDKPDNSSIVPKMVVICGPTASGKSGLAIALATRWQSMILSADSRQVYREFNIGTAKPNAFEQQQVPHSLIDICDPTETLTLAEYQAQAKRVIAEWMGDESGEESLRGAGDAKIQGGQLSKQEETQGLPLLLVGGTGLYIRSIVRGLKIPRVAPQPALRSQLQALGQCQLYAMLQQVDPMAAARIHANDETRTLRALEVFYVTGQPISAQQGEDPPNYPILQIGLDCAEPEAIAQRIHQRTHQMVAEGLVEEVAFLCEKYGAELPLLDTLGYREMKQYLAGEVPLAAAIDLTVLHTRQFAKRQRTWFRADPTIEWFDADAPDLLEQVWQRVQEFEQVSDNRK
ncbi:MAG: tRNA (adenosine(37)-N6)-dimethylallyltransferase MiaA [Scytolyngbya sp. HA4215-MV1]|jgi:tRNA dimethylallyltransferase|nr:tRNA (adenosine(37)-N6)-dimethylallyltransferase MiaA [Scytolyngbya sp. HA4215-MV1]